MKHLLTLGVTFLIALGLTPLAAAESDMGDYTTGTTPIIGLVCAPDCLGLGVNVGGYTFPAAPSQPLSVKIADASGGPVSYSVCQDFNDDGLCGNTDPTVGALEPSVNGCGTAANLATSGVAFKAGVRTSVFITTFDPLAGCGGTALGGTITITYA